MFKTFSALARRFSLLCGFWKGKSSAKTMFVFLFFAVFSIFVLKGMWCTACLFGKGNMITFTVVGSLKIYICLWLQLFFNGFTMSAVVLGEFAALGAAVCWAVAPILYRRALFKTKPVSANIVRCVSNAAVLLFLLFALGKAGVLASLPMGVVAVTVVSGVIGLGIGDTLYMIGLK